MLAAVIAAGSPMPVRAADFEIEVRSYSRRNRGRINGAGMKKSRRRHLFQGTVVSFRNEIADQDMQAKS